LFISPAQPEKNRLIPGLFALGRFRLQFKLLGRALFGMHGSFILVPAVVENAIGAFAGPLGISRLGSTHVRGGVDCWGQSHRPRLR
jgi:hypothetical protein